MTTVKEFKDLGLEFAFGDMCKDLFTLKSYGDAKHGNGWVYQVANGRPQFNNDKLISFAWRPLNTLPDNPKFKYEVDTELHSWRPLLEQLKQSAYDVDAHVSEAKGGAIPNNILGQMYEVDKRETIVPNKPVFTQAMADAEYAPEAGFDCEIMLDGYWQRCFIVGMSKKGNPVIELGAHCTESIGCNYRALDTRTPKQKAVDEIHKIIIDSFSSVQAARIIYDMMIDEKC